MKRLLPIAIAAGVLAVALAHPAVAKGRHPRSRTTVSHGLVYINDPGTLSSAVGGCDDPAYVARPHHTSAIRATSLQSAVLNLNGVPAALDAKRLQAEIQQAMINWNDERNPCGLADRSPFAFALTGTVSQVPIPRDDGVHMVMFSDGVCRRPVDVACVYMHADPSSGALLGWDIVLDPTYSWGFGEGAFLDVQNTLAHEFGHVVGLEHVGTTALGGCDAQHLFLTMVACTWPGDTWKRDLAMGDALGVEVYGHAS